MYNVNITDEIMQGNPLQIEMYLRKELANMILQIDGSNYESVCQTMRELADVFEILEEHINEEEITLKYNPMGAWYQEYAVSVESEEL